MMWTLPFRLTERLRLSEAMKQAVLSAEWSSGAKVGLLDGLTFHIETASLKIADRVSNMLLLAGAGKPGPVAVERPGTSVSAA